MIYKSKYNPLTHNRHSLRLKGYDYTKSGLYFITICCQNRAHLFGEILNQQMILNDAGEMIKKEWLSLAAYFENIKLHEFVIMPNHFHSILEITGATLVVAQNDIKITEEIGQPQGIAPTTKTLGNIIGAFKSKTTVEYIKGVKNLNWEEFEGKVWQRNFYENIIRNEKSYHRIANYIINNPENFKEDKFFKKSDF